MISVCMAVHNGSKYIKEQIDSILPQLSKNDELIISDDGSTDGTVEIILSYSDSRIKLIKLSPTVFLGHFSKFRSVSVNFENSLSNANGDIIFLADQDDIWMPNKVEQCLKYLNEYTLVRTNSLLITSDGLPIHLSYKEGENPIKASLLKNILAMRFSGSHMAFHKKLLCEILPFPKGLISHDNWIGCIAFKYGTCKYVASAFLKYRVHGGNISRSQHNSLFSKLSYRIIFAFYLYKRILFSK